FASGILISLVVIGFITGLAGNILGDTGGIGGYVVGALLIIFGLMLADLLPLPFLEITVKPVFKKKGKLAIFLIGLVFGIALGPCSFAFMAPLLGIVFASAAKDLPAAIMLMFFYALGHCAVIVFAGTFTHAVSRFLKWNESSKGFVWVKRICGILVVLAGAYLIIEQIL
ncbi:MAG: cytochrome C biogenesis protein, partial [Spirochaetaceae bacterium]